MAQPTKENPLTLGGWGNEPRCSLWAALGSTQPSQHVSSYMRGMQVENCTKMQGRQNKEAANSAASLFPPAPKQPPSAIADHDRSKHQRPCKQIIHIVS